MEKYQAGNEILDLINSDPTFNAFIGQCMIHFMRFVVPRRDQTRIIEQDYQIPDNVSTNETAVLFKRKAGNRIFIEFLNEK